VTWGGSKGESFGEQKEEKKRKHGFFLFFWREK
jgi:hypothetical protein